MDVIPGLLSVNGEPCRIFWTSNLFVPPETRNSLAGVMLVVKFQGYGPTVGVVGVSQEALPLYHKFKWDEVPMARYVMIRRSRAVVERYVAQPWLRGTARVMADAALSAHRGLGRAVRSLMLAGLAVQQVDRADDELDRHLAPGGQGIETHRSAAMLNWQLENSFDADGRNRKGLFHVRDRGGRLVGYFLAKVRFYETATHRRFRNLLLGSLADWRIFDPSALSPGQLLLLAVREISAWNPDAVELCLPPSCGPARLRRWGFFRVGSLSMFVQRSPQSPTRQSGAPEPRAWLVRPGDGDYVFS